MAVLLITFSILVSCVTNRLIKTSGIEVIEITSRVYDTAGNQFSNPGWTFKGKVWIKDSLGIEEVTSLNIVTDTANHTTEKLVIDHYRFTDLRTKTIYEYRNFSDTAGVTKKYSYADTLKLQGGWVFLAKRKLDYRGQPENLGDTVIEEVSYKRMRLLRGTDNDPYFMDCYFRCDKKGTIFTHDPLLSRLVGCPLVKTYNYSPLKKGVPSSTEIEFISDTLTVTESKVFDAWEQNARSNPIN